MTQEQCIHFLRQPDLNISELATQLNLSRNTIKKVRDGIAKPSAYVTSTIAIFADSRVQEGTTNEPSTIASSLLAIGNLRYECNRRQGNTQRVAAELGVSPNTIYRWLLEPDDPFHRFPSAIQLSKLEARYSTCDTVDPTLKLLSDKIRNIEWTDDVVQEAASVAEHVDTNSYLWLRDSICDALRAGCKPNKSAITFYRAFVGVGSAYKDYSELEPISRMWSHQSTSRLSRLNIELSRIVRRRQKNPASSIHILPALIRFYRKINNERPETFALRTECLCEIIRTAGNIAFDRATVSRSIEDDLSISMSDLARIYQGFSPDVLPRTQQWLLINTAPMVNILSLFFSIRSPKLQLDPWRPVMSPLEQSQMIQMETTILALSSLKTDSRVEQLHALEEVSRRVANLDPQLFPHTVDRMKFNEETIRSLVD